MALLPSRRYAPGVVEQAKGPGAAPHYVCPICVEGFVREDVANGTLTEEHVPPEALGGRGLILTCESLQQHCRNGVCQQGHGRLGVRPRGIRLIFIRPAGRRRMPSSRASTAGCATNASIVKLFGSVAEAQAVLDAWRDDYNQVWPHSALQDRTPVEWAQYVTESRETRDSVSINESEWKPRPKAAQSPFRRSAFGVLVHADVLAIALRLENLRGLLLKMSADVASDPVHLVGTNTDTGSS